MLGEKITNMMKIEIICADTTVFLNSANALGVFIYNIRNISPFCVHCWVKTSDYDTLHQLCARQGIEINIIRKKGISELSRIIVKRPVLLAGVFLFLVLLIFLPSRVLFIQVDGNQNIAEQEVVSAAERCGIYFGASRKNVRSEKVKNALLSELGNLQWAGVTTKGCVAVISVKEKTTAAEIQPPKVSSIVASRDGIITSCVCEEGNLLCTVGQAVQKGQLLISGFTDCGLSIRATQSSGEITAKTNRKIHVIMPTENSQRLNITEQKKKISLLIGKKRINLWKGSGICDATCDRIYKEYYVMLPGGYSLPVGISIDSCYAYQTNVNTNMQDSMSNIVADYAKEYIQQQMIAGNILKRTESFAAYDNRICMTGEYVCTEMIGIVQQEQIGE